MIVTTTPNVEGYQIAEYKGIVVGEAIMGANVVRDVFASITTSWAAVPALMKANCRTRAKPRWQSWKTAPAPKVPMRLSVSILITKWSANPC